MHFACPSTSAIILFLLQVQSVKKWVGKFARACNFKFYNRYVANCSLLGVPTSDLIKELKIELTSFLIPRLGWGTWGERAVADCKWCSKMVALLFSSSIQNNPQWCLVTLISTIGICCIEDGWCIPLVVKYRSPSPRNKPSIWGQMEWNFEYPLKVID